MALREFGLIWNLVMGSMHHIWPCCQEAMGKVAEYRKNMAIVQDTLSRNPDIVEQWGSDPSTCKIRLMEAILNPDITELGRALTPAELRKISYDNKRNASAVLRQAEIERVGDLKALDKEEKAKFLKSLFPEEDVAEMDALKSSIHGILLQEYGVSSTEELSPADAAEFRKTERLLADSERIADDFFIGIMQANLTRTYTGFRITNLERVTYIHDAHHTFQTWMMHTRRRSAQTSLLTALKNMLDEAISSPETVIYGDCSVKTWAPKRRRAVFVPPTRILDHHKQNPHTKRRSLTAKEKAKRDTRRRISAASKRRNRERDQ